VRASSSQRGRLLAAARSESDAKEAWDWARNDNAGSASMDKQQQQSSGDKSSNKQKRKKKKEEESQQHQSQQSAENAQLVKAASLLSSSGKPTTTTTTTRREGSPVSPSSSTLKKPSKKAEKVKVRFELVLVHLCNLPTKLHDSGSRVLVRWKTSSSRKKAGADNALQNKAETQAVEVGADGRASWEEGGEKFLFEESLKYDQINKSFSAKRFIELVIKEVRVWSCYCQFLISTPHRSRARRRRTISTS